MILSNEMTALDELACRNAMEKAGLSDLYLYGFSVHAEGGSEDDCVELKDEDTGKTYWIGFDGIIKNIA